MNLYELIVVDTCTECAGYKEWAFFTVANDPSTAQNTVSAWIVENWNDSPDSKPIDMEMLGLYVKSITVVASMNEADLFPMLVSEEENNAG